VIDRVQREANQDAMARQMFSASDLGRELAALNRSIALNELRMEGLADNAAGLLFLLKLRLRRDDVLSKLRYKDPKGVEDALPF
jgi:hypothetical protein